MSGLVRGTGAFLIGDMDDSSLMPAERRCEVQGRFIALVESFNENPIVEALSPLFVDSGDSAIIVLRDTADAETMQRFIAEGIPDVPFTFAVSVGDVTYLDDRPFSGEAVYSALALLKKNKLEKKAERTE